MSDLVNGIERTFCSRCEHVMAPYYGKCPKCEGDRNRAKVDALAEVIRAVKATVEEPVREDEMAYLTRRLRELDHPNVEGLLTWVGEAKAVRGSGGRRR